MNPGFYSVGMKMISLNKVVSGVRGMSAPTAIHKVVSLSHLALEHNETEQNRWQGVSNCPRIITSNELLCIPIIYPISKLATWTNCRSLLIDTL